LLLGSWHTFKQDPSDENLNFAREIEKILVAKFSVVDIHLLATGHVYGATLSHLLQVLSVYSAIKVLKVNLVISDESEVTFRCTYCSLITLTVLLQDSFIYVFFFVNRASINEGNFYGTFDQIILLL
jgi:hypothetical protein